MTDEMIYYEKCIRLKPHVLVRHGVSGFLKDIAKELRDVPLGPNPKGKTVRVKIYLEDSE